jgi:hypothetical protein
MINLLASMTNNPASDAGKSAAKTTENTQTIKTAATLATSSAAC